MRERGERERGERGREERRKRDTHTCARPSGADAALSVGYRETKRER